MAAAEDPKAREGTVEELEGGINEKSPSHDETSNEYQLAGSARERALVWKQDLRIVPLVCGHLPSLLPGSVEYRIALMVFLIAYALFEVPSNYLLKKLRPSRWIAFLMLSWGAITMGLGGAHNYAQVTGIRFLLGVVEAGLFPGLVFYLTFWYRTSERSIRVALILASATLAGAFGGAIAYGVGHMNEVYFGISTPFSSLSLFTPSITAGLGYSDLRAQLMTVPPYAVAYVVTVAVSWSADHFNARGLHSAAFSLIGAMGFLASAVLPADAYLHRYGCLIVACSGSFACIPPLLGWLSSNLQTTAAAGLAIALNVSFGAPGQIVGVWIYKANEAEKGYPTGHWTNAGLLLFVCAGCIVLRVYYAWMNRRRAGLADVKPYAY
ncbi:MFS transporter [Rasamsonia emersonii CBS 393.64]|uniref:MFS transporter n=1 Tax=Rasamsonia emersonii (strain ATCC 16479 / CBS 393.64 / IMI 116815) TaxID=1408163 RepID=A0A0F4YR49_RASE3|nr:MFS transporter [Rasamsonia emersonii CBS 393.64]KKA20108.1 MFS transporter [Rasamsonia emersonii CBS 393.64]